MKIIKKKNSRKYEQHIVKNHKIYKERSYHKRKSAITRAKSDWQRVQIMGFEGKIGEENNEPTDKNNKAYK